MKTLKLKKKLISQLSESKMEDIKGGISTSDIQNSLFNTHFACLTIKSKGCHTQNSCTVFACF